MNKQKFIELQRKSRENEGKMTEEERKALSDARRRHAKKVRDEILTSYEMNKRNEKGNTDNRLP